MSWRPALGDQQNLVEAQTILQGTYRGFASNTARDSRDRRAPFSTAWDTSSLHATSQHENTHKGTSIARGERARVWPPLRINSTMVRISFCRAVYRYNGCRREANREKRRSRDARGSGIDSRRGSTKLILGRLALGVLA